MTAWKISTSNSVEANENPMPVSMLFKDNDKQPLSPLSAATIQM